MRVEVSGWRDYSLPAFLAENNGVPAHLLTTSGVVGCDVETCMHATDAIGASQNATKRFQLVGHAGKLGLPASHQQLLEKLQRRLKHVEATNRSLAAKLASHASPVAQSETSGDGNEVGSETRALNNVPGEATSRLHETEEDENDVIEEVTFLSSGAGGEQHFLGSASGVFLASLVSATMVSSPSQGTQERGPRGRRSSRFPPVSLLTTASSEASALPSEQVARNLHRAYFEHDHLCYPFLHRESTLCALDQAYQDPSFLEQDAFASFAFGMILAIATASVHKFNIEALPDAEAYQIRATQRLNEVMRDGGIQALQALLLLCQYRMTNSIQDTSTTAREKLANDLAQWQHETAALSLPEIDLSNPLLGGQSSYRAREWYELLYYNALLMLYRPSPALSSASPHDAGVLQTIFVAAKQAITLYSHLHRSRRINYTWITLHSVFMAGLSYVYAVGRHFRARKRRTAASTSSLLQSDPTIIEIVHDSRACSNVLVGISERWNVTKHCHDVFNRLTDAMLADAIEYHSHSAAGQPKSAALRPDESLLPVDATGASATLNILGFTSWDINDPTPSSLGVDSVLRECFDDLRRFQMLEGHGDDPVGRLFHDWLGEIGDIDMDLPSMW
ncbi:hypothetical protein APSETT444_007387 [Aspergillus pseudonomiae]